MDTVLNSKKKYLCFAGAKTLNINNISQYLTELLNNLN